MMGLISSSIDRVRAFALAAGIAADGISVNEPLSVLVKWRSQHGDKLHQVYVNGEFFCLVIVYFLYKTCSKKLEEYEYVP